ncbi:MAG: DUF2007 domain-containing protein [Acutalibacteraceae bacterium]|mgnify:CR=1 FL=1|nr:DUF2007 domain-containing protein [Clostridia bacterium]MEE1329683.1 DUF2007 domain-containing protein [Acutalibacteraceae bacterium]
MKICHVCKAECADEAELCPVCGAELDREIEEQQSESEEVIIKTPVLLATVEDIVSAEILKDLLTESGIKYSSDSAEETMHIGFGGALSADDIYVDESDFEAASVIYEDFLNSEADFEEDFFDETENPEE